jgi:hypothetical protein
MDRIEVRHGTEHASTMAGWCLSTARHVSMTLVSGEHAKAPSAEMDATASSIPSHPFGPAGHVEACIESLKRYATPKPAL